MINYIDGHLIKSACVVKHALMDWKFSTNDGDGVKEKMRNLLIIQECVKYSPFGMKFGTEANSNVELLYD